MAIPLRIQLALVAQPVGLATVPVAAARALAVGRPRFARWTGFVESREVEELVQHLGRALLWIVGGQPTYQIPVDQCHLERLECPFDSIGLAEDVATATLLLDLLLDASEVPRDRRQAVQDLLFVRLHVSTPFQTHATGHPGGRRS